MAKESAINIVPLLGAGGAVIGENQTLNCGVVQNHYSPNQDTAFVGLLGLDAFLTKKHSTAFFKDFQIGTGLMIFTPAKLSGFVFQELRFQNLAFSYNVQNTTLLAQLKKTFSHTGSHPSHIILGIGANISRTSNYHERALNTTTIANPNIFVANTKVNPAAMIGAGVHLTKRVVLNGRVYYLGQAKLNANLNLNLGNQYQMKTRHQFAFGLLISYQVEGQNI